MARPQRNLLRSQLFTAGAVIAAVLAVSTKARADRLVDGNRLYELCTPNSRSSEFCDDYVLSVADALMVGRVGGWTACIPNSVTGNQVVDVVKRFLEAHPAKRRSAAFGLVAEALAEGFPCERGGGAGR
jgi:hypothetical protein